MDNFEILEKIQPEEKILSVSQRSEEFALIEKEIEKASRESRYVSYYYFNEDEKNPNIILKNKLEKVKDLYKNFQESIADSNRFRVSSFIFDLNNKLLLPQLADLNYFEVNVNDGLSYIEESLRNKIVPKLRWEIMSLKEYISAVSDEIFEQNIYDKNIRFKDAYHSNILLRDFDSLKVFVKGEASNEKEGFPLFVDRSFEDMTEKEIFLKLLQVGLVPEGGNNGSALDEDLLREVLSDNFIGAVEIKNNDFVVKDDLVLELENNNLDEEIQERLLEEDFRRSELEAYSKNQLTDIEAGHWSLWNNYKQGRVKVKLAKPLVARNPLADIQEGGLVGIDFGTKNTVVVKQAGNSSVVQPMRIGIGNLSKKVEALDYENPTIMEFIDFRKFFKDYKNLEHYSRPNTSWDDLTVSHTALNSLEDLNSSQKRRCFVNELKQYAGTPGKAIRVEDEKNSEDYNFEAYKTLQEGDKDLLEIYAYFLGLNINNMRNGIYLKYLMSFPVTYEFEVRERIQKSFERGLKKSLPREVSENEELMASFEVKAGQSEPAAYAVIALDSYRFEPEDDEKIFYGVFDFGGGTTDFDFGIYRAASEDNREERKKDFVLEHFGSGGDRYLGGENLLELLSFEVFLDNLDLLRKNKITFRLPPEKIQPAGTETLISKKADAGFNTNSLMNKLRPFWEKHEGWKEKWEESPENDELKVLLFNDSSMQENLDLTVNYNKLQKILRERISYGIKNFFERLNEVAKTINLAENTRISIFLAGNSSKSELVDELFQKAIKEQSQENSFIFDLYPALGTEAAYQKMEALELPFDKNNPEEPTGKTGVAFGLVRSQKAIKVLVLDKDLKAQGSEGKDINFQFYLGESRKKKFKIKIRPKDDYNKWFKFAYGDEDEFDIFYTNLPLAESGDLSIDEVKLKTVKISPKEDAFVYIRLVSPTKIDYVVATRDEEILGKFSGQIKTIEFVN